MLKKQPEIQKIKIDPMPCKQTAWKKINAGESTPLERMKEIGELNMGKRYFEDLFDGECLHCKTVKITKEAILSFGKEFDPQPFHISEQKGRESMFNGLIASSLHTLSACTRVVVDALGDVIILSGVGMDEVKMTNPVRPGDILTVNAWWTNLKQSESKPDFGFGTVRCQVMNQKDQPVIEYGYQYLIASISTLG